MIEVSPPVLGDEPIPTTCRGSQEPFIETAKFGTRLPCTTESGCSPITQNSSVSLSPADFPHLEHSAEKQGNMI